MIFFIELLAIASSSNCEERREDSMQENAMWDDACFHEVRAFVGLRSNEECLNAEDRHRVESDEAHAESDEHEDENESEIGGDRNVEIVGIRIRCRRIIVVDIRKCELRQVRRAARDCHRRVLSHESHAFC